MVINLKKEEAAFTKDKSYFQSRGLCLKTHIFWNTVLSLNLSMQTNTHTRTTITCVFTDNHNIFFFKFLNMIAYPFVIVIPSFYWHRFTAVILWNVSLMEYFYYKRLACQRLYNPHTARMKEVSSRAKPQWKKTLVINTTENKGWSHFLALK